MYFEYDEVEGYTEVIAEAKDSCVLCRNFDDCPLIKAISDNVVYPSAAQLIIEDCPMYELELGQDYTQN